MLAQLPFLIINLLFQAIEEKTPKGVQSKGAEMFSVQERLTDIFSEAISNTFPDIPEVPTIITVSSNSQFGDYQCNSVMPIMQILKSQGIKWKPSEVGNMIIDNIPEDDLIDLFEVAGPGFINISLKKDLIEEALTNLIIDGVKPPHLQEKKKVIVDFSSPNIAKEMHVGHLRYEKFIFIQ